MRIHDHIRKTGLVTIWCILGAAMGILLIAAINRKNSRVCTGIRIDILRTEGHFFVTRQEVEDLLTSSGADSLKGEIIASVNLRKKEEQMLKNIWIRDARIFFDNTGLLHVRVREREPIARIFTSAGNSFYIDSGGVQLPVLDRQPAKVPVFTSFPAAKWTGSRADSALRHQVRRLAGYILGNPFWMAEIEQVNINPDRTFEMVPVIGNHRIVFGDGNDCEKKFHNLYVFYREVMSRTGFERYTRVNLAYLGQVIGTRRENSMARIDSQLVNRSIERMIRSAQQIQADTPRKQNVQPLEHDQVSEQGLGNYDLIPADTDDLSGGSKKPAAPVRRPRRNKTSNH
jgi:cell division protein FtsQ